MFSLAACGGNPMGGADDPGDNGGEDPDPITRPVNARNSGDLRRFNYDGKTLKIDMEGVSASGEYGTFNRAPRMDIPAHEGVHPGYLAYTFQETHMTRSYLAYVARNERNSLIAVSAADGGQFNQVNQGGGWIRVTGYSRPEVARGSTSSPGPEQGTFSYYGSYAGVFSPGPEAVNGAPRPDPLRPGAPLNTRGVIQVNAQFTLDGRGEVVEGGITERQLFDRAGNQVTQITMLDAQGTPRTLDTTELADLTLRETQVAADGTFLGSVEFDGAPDTSIGNYDGAFGGQGASDVAGVLLINPIAGESGIWEQGVFNLPRCDLAGASPICAPR